MNLHEYQSKILFNEFGIPVPVGFTINDSSKAISVAKKIGGNAWVVKAQIHAGARGKAGAVKLVNSEQELIETSQYLLGNNIATPQTHGKKLPVNTLLIEQTLNIKKEYYLGILIDRKTECITFMASTEGGMNIEDVALNTPDKIVTINVHPSSSLQAFQCRQIAFALNLEGKQINQLTKIMMGLYKLFCSKDLSLIEINPLIIDSEDQLLALDAKVSVDDNALYRLPDILNLRDTSQEDEKENEAATHQLNYITLDGNIGCMVNGAGLAMATMDLIKLHGGEPANFLDVGGGTTAERVAEAFKLILSENKVKAILVNIFGGIVRCDLIAKGIIHAVKEVGVSIPVIVRLEGTNASQGLSLLADSNLNIEIASDLTEAAKKAVSSVSIEGEE